MSAVPMTPLDVLSLALINEYTDSPGKADLIDAAMVLAWRGYKVFDMSSEYELWIRVGA